ncbi:hypothetical protein M8J77_016770 [Diaphorina citri]|nr:hypothetical protein M8J77_016770 [Diaphorina citri]
MSDICKALNLDMECLRQSCITIEEREHMDATFMLLSLVHLFLKEKDDTKDTGGHVVLVLFQNNFQHLNNIAMKLFMNLKSLIQNKKLTLLEVYKEETSVKEKFLFVHNAISDINAQEKIVVFSNLNNLSYMGASSRDVFNFAQYIRNTNSEDVCILHCTHNKKDTAIHTLNNAFKHMSSYVLEVSNLRTGFCKEISGHINVSNKYKDYKKNHHFQYTNRGVNVFLPGALSTR